MPAGTVVNDIMLMFISVHEPACTPTLPAGWTIKVQGEAATGTGVMAWKRALGSEAGPYDVTGLADSACGVILSFSGCLLSGDPISAFTYRINASGVSGTTSVAASGTDGVYVFGETIFDNLAVSGWSAAGPPTMTPTERADGRTSIGSDTGVAVATQDSGIIYPNSGAWTCTIASPSSPNVGICCYLKARVNTSLPDDGVPNSIHAHDATTVDPLDVELTLTDSCSHAHTTDNISPDVMLVVADTDHTHIVDMPTIVHNVFVSVYTHLFCWLIAVPAVGGIPGPKIPRGCNASELSSYVTGSGKTVTFNIEERTDQDVAGTNILAADQVADDNGVTTGTFANKYLAKDNYLWLDISAADADSLMLSITLAATDETDLELASSAHGHYVDNVDLTQAHDLAVQDSDHAHDAENISLGAMLATNNSDHAHDADNITLVEDAVVVLSGIPGFWTWVIDHPIVGGTPGPKVSGDATISFIQSYVTTGTSVRYNIEIRSTIGVPGTDVMADEQQAVEQGSLDITMAEPHVSAGQWLWLDISTVDGTPDILMVTIGYNVSSLQALEDCTHAHTVSNVSLDVDLVVSDSTHAHTAENAILSIEEPSGLEVPGFYTWTIYNPVAGVVPGPKMVSDIDLVEISSYVTAGTSATFNLESRGDHALAGFDVLAADQVADIGGESATSLVVVTVNKDRWLCLDISAVSGTPGILTVTASWLYVSGGVADCVHGHVVDNVVLTADEDILLTVANANHAHDAEATAVSTLRRRYVAVELVVTPTLLVVSDSTHAHTATNATLSGNTRIYFPSSGSVVNTYPNNAAWDETWDHDVVSAVFEKGTTALATKSCTTQNFSTVHVLNRQYVLAPVDGLAAREFTTADEFDFVVRAIIDTISQDINLYLTIDVYSYDGLTLRGTIYDGMFNSTAVNDILQSRSATNTNLTGNVSMQGGDVLVFGMGIVSADALGTTYTIGQNFGDLPATALDLSDIDTGADYPYLDFNFQLSPFSATLVVADSTHAHDVDNISFMDVGLETESSDHAHDCDAVVLQGINTVLVVANCTHAHSAAVVAFEVPGGRRIWVKKKGTWIQIVGTTV